MTTGVLNEPEIFAFNHVLDNSQSSILRFYRDFSEWLNLNFSNLIGFSIVDLR
jgi:hypothetical protein